MDLDDNETVLSAAEFLRDLDETQRRLLAFSSERLTHQEGDVLYRARAISEGAHVLISGVLEARGERGEPTRVFEEPGVLLAAMALIVAKPRPVTLVARTKSETLFIPRTAFMKLVRSYPDLAGRLAEQVRKELSEYVRTLRPLRTRLLPDEE